MSQTAVLTTTERPKSRVVWLDNAKALGIILVFYGHLLEAMFVAHDPAIFPQFKMVYSFHMPLFFILAGFVAKNREEGFRQYFKYRVLTRLVPFLFFNLLALGCLLLIHAGEGTFHPQQYLQEGVSMLRGLPGFNMLTWFLVCLFMVEMIHFGLRPYLSTPFRQLVAACVFLAVGLFVTRSIMTNPYLIPKNFWYIHEALLAYGFYLLGVFLRQVAFVWAGKQWWLMGVTAMIFFWLTLTTFDFNSGPFVTGTDVVLMATSSHGHYFWFLFTAVTGSLFIIFLSKVIPPFPPLLYIGQNTLILLGLNGLFFEFFNQRIVGGLWWWWQETVWGVTIQLWLVTGLSLLISGLFIYFFNKYLPQLVGKPQAQGPWLPNLI